MSRHAETSTQAVASPGSSFTRNERPQKPIARKRRHGPGKAGAGRGPAKGQKTRIAFGANQDVKKTSSPRVKAREDDVLFFFGVEEKTPEGRKKKNLCVQGRSGGAVCDASEVSGVSVCSSSPPACFMKAAGEGCHAPVGRWPAPCRLLVFGVGLMLCVKSAGGRWSDCGVRRQLRVICPIRL